MDTKVVQRKSSSNLVLPGLTERSARTAPDRVALIAGDCRLSYRELHELALRCVAALRASGIAPGDRIGYLGLNSIDYVILLQAASRTGAVLVAVNWRLAPAEIGFIVADANLALIVTEQERLGSVEALVPTVLLTNAVHKGRPQFREWIATFGPDDRLAELAPGDVALQLYTSGTTGRPKGAMLTHGSLSASLAQGQLIGERWAEWRPDDVGLIAMPQFHIGGTAWTLQALNGSGTAVLLTRPEIGDILAVVETFGVTKMFAVPAVLAMILAHPQAASADLRSVRALLYGASPIPLDVLKRSMKLFPSANFVQMYGSTETSGTIVYLPPEDHQVAGTPRMASCGKPYPQVQLRIADTAGQNLSIGAVGEVLVRSPMVMKGYYGLPVATSDAFDGEWLRTGDAGFRDADGYLYLIDRIKDMIVSGGENIYPAEVENALFDHPGVDDCAVIGVPHPTWGEAVMALVVRAGDALVDEAELIAFARDRIAGYKVPKSITFVETLPRTSSGKVLKRELRSRYWPANERHVA